MEKKRAILYWILVVLLFFYNFYFRPIKGNPLVTDSYRNSKDYLNDLYMSDGYFDNGYHQYRLMEIK